MHSFIDIVYAQYARQGRLNPIFAHTKRRSLFVLFSVQFTFWNFGNLVSLLLCSGVGGF